MKRNLLSIFLTLCACVIANQSKAQYDLPIDKGIIKGDFTISFVDQNIIIKPNQFFTLSGLGLKANTKSSEEVDIHGFGGKHWKDIIYYKIKLQRPSDNTIYYGIIMFYNTNKSHKKDPECQYYEISAGEKLFDGAKDGHVSEKREFWYRNEQYQITQETWMMYFSDSEKPFMK